VTAAEPIPAEAEERFQERHREFAVETDLTSVEFDWCTLERSLGDSCPEMEPTDYALLAHALRIVMRWLTSTKRTKRLRGEQAEYIGRKALVLAWVIDPSIIEGSPALRHLAAELGISRSMLSKLAVRAAQFTGRPNRSQRAATAAVRRRVTRSPHAGRGSP
jgi:hypothetical protein